MTGRIIELVRGEGCVVTIAITCGQSEQDGDESGLLLVDVLQESVHRFLVELDAEAYE
jgi:hypothetical protein